MRRPLAATALAAAALAAALGAATLASAAPRAARAETGWHVLSASGVIQLTIDKADPQSFFQQLEATVVGKWRSTGYPTDLTLTFPLNKLRKGFPPAQSFTVVEKIRTSLSGSAKGVYGDPSPNSSQPPKPFACSHEYKTAPPDFLTQNAAQLYGGSLSGATMGMGLYTAYPYLTFNGCAAPYGGDVKTLLSTEQIRWQDATYRPIPIGMLAHGRKGEKVTLVVGLTAPIQSSDTGPVVGKVVSTATLHLQFNFSA